MQSQASQHVIDINVSIWTNNERKKLIIKYNFLKSHILKYYSLFMDLKQISKDNQTKMLERIWNIQELTVTILSISVNKNSVIAL